MAKSRYRCQETGRVFDEDEIVKEIDVVKGCDAAGKPIILKMYLHESCDCHAVKIEDAISESNSSFNPSDI
jgi:hypothetical protein